MKVKALLLSAVLLAACGEPESDEPPAAPEPIGPELMSFNIVFGSFIGCSQVNLYRASRALQYQCFTSDGGFSWENRGTLSADGLVLLDAELAAADFSNTAPGEDKHGLCKGGSESNASTTILWVGDESFSYESACPTAGIQGLHDVLQIIVDDIGDCMELDLLESVEPGCRAY